MLFTVLRSQLLYQVQAVDRSALQAMASMVIGPDQAL